MSGADSLDFDFIKQGPADPIAQEVVGRWTEWKGARSSWEANVEETKKFRYATSTRETTNVQNAHDHSTHLPKLAQVADNLHANYMAALFPHDDWLKFEGADEEEESFDKKQAVLGYLNTKHKLNKFQTAIERCLDDWINTGNCFAGVTYVHETHADPDTGEIVTGYVGPKVYRISPHDIVFNPLASDFKSTPKIVRSLKTLGELSRAVEENPELQYSADILKKVLDTREGLKKYTDIAVDKHVQMMYDGFGSASQYYNSGYVEILEFYGDIYDTNKNEWLKNYVITVVDRQWVIRAQPNPTITGRPNIFHCAWRPRPDNLWGMGPLDNLVGMQYLINHLENARADAFDQMIDPDRVITGDVDVQRRGGAVDYYVPEGGAVAYLAPDTTILQADLLIEQKMQQMEETAGAPKEAMGIRTPGEKTAFEVSSLQNAASRIFQAKTNYFSENFVEDLVNAELEVARRNIIGTDVVRILDDDFGVVDFLRITKDDITAKGTLVPVGARHFARQATLAQNLQQFQIALQQDPMLAQHFPAERLARAWEDVLGFKRLELFDRFGRIDEEVELESKRRAAQEQLELNDMVAAGGQQTDPNALLPTQDVVGALAPIR